MFQAVHPIAFQDGSFKITWYGIFVALGFMCGLWMASRRALRDRISPETIIDLGPWLLVGAVVGARIMYVTTYWKEEFAGRPFYEVFMVQHGGIVYYGGLMGSSAACILYTWFKKLPLWRVADILAPSVALGNFFGRWGCLLNGCCYGKPTTMPWGIQFPPGHPTHSLYVHPTEIYDSLLNLGLYLYLAWLYRRKKFDGQVFATYLIFYAIFRSFVEIFRGDYTPIHYWGGLTPAQMISIGTIVVGGILLWKLPRTRSDVVVPINMAAADKS